MQKGKGTLRPTTRLNFLVAVYEKTKELLSLTLRIEEAFPNEVEVISDLNELVFLMNELSRDFDRIFEDSERSTFTAPSSLNDCLSTVAGHGLVGRPRLQTLQQELQTLTMTPVFVGLISEEFLESPEELCAVEDMNLGCQLVWERILVMSPTMTLTNM